MSTRIYTAGFNLKRYALLILAAGLLLSLIPASVARVEAATVISIAAGDDWRYLKGTAEPAATWADTAFDDSAWLIGASGFGYGDADDGAVLADMQNGYSSVYARHTFALADPAVVTGLALSVDYDDSFVAYLNGTEVARANVLGNPPAFNTTASSDHEASGGNTSPQPVANFDLTTSLGLLVAGNNTLAVQGHNVSIGSSDFSLIPTLVGSSGPPAAPTALAATAVADTQINLVWTDNSFNEGGFEIEMSVGGGAFALIDTVAPNVTAYSDTGLTTLTTYTYRVRSINAVDGSAYTNEDSATTLSALAAGLTILEGDLWRYFKGTVEPPVGWNANGFDDSTWLAGPSGFGMGDGDDATILSDMANNYASVYVRKEFSVGDPDNVVSLLLAMDYDDAFVAYLNGTEIARHNVIGTPPAYTKTAERDHEASAGNNSPQAPAQYDISGFASLLVAGTNTLAVQGHNLSLSNADFSLIPTLVGLEITSLVDIQVGDAWSYLKGTAEPPATWNDIVFDASAWLSGPTGIGYNDADDATLLSDMRNGYTSVYARKEFELASPNAVTTLMLTMDFDDGFVAYLNGTEVVRRFVTGTPPAFDAVTDLDHEASNGDTNAQPVEDFNLSSFTNLLVAGTNVLAIQGHNFTLGSSDFSLIPSMVGTDEPLAQVLPITPGDIWRYRKGTSEPPANWTSPVFDDFSWLTGPTGIGYGDGDDATVLSDMKNGYYSVYARKDFYVENPATIDFLTLTMDFDDGYVAYLNGVEIARTNLLFVPPAYNEAAGANREAAGGDFNAQPPEVIDITAFKNVLVPGVNTLAVQGHNATFGSSDFSLIPSLSTTSAPSNASLFRTPYLQKPGSDAMTVVWATLETGAAALQYGFDWTDLNYNDSDWLTGPSGIGYGDGDDATTLSDMKDGYSSLYTRHVFNIADPSVIVGVNLTVDYDDAFVAYLNGVEVARGNVSGVPLWNTLADSEHEASGGDASPQPADTIDVSQYGYLLRTGVNVLAVQGLNSSISSTDFSLIPTLEVLDPNPVTVIAPGATWSYLKGFAEPVFDVTGPTAVLATTTAFAELGGYYHHVADVTGLLPSTRYSYRVQLDGQTVEAGERLTFRTAPTAEEGNFTFIFTGDAGQATAQQYAIRDLIEQEQFDLFLMQGDVSQYEGTPEQYQADFFNVYNNLVNKVPMLATIGNHDVITLSAQPFLDVFELPSNGPVGREEEHFSFEYSNALFIGLNSEDITEADASWVESVLAASTAEWKFVFHHRPAFGEGSVHPINQVGAVALRSFFTRIFEEQGVDLDFAGHNHIYGRSAPLNNSTLAAPYAEMSTIDDGGVVYVTTGGGGGLLYSPYTDAFHQPPNGYTQSIHHYTRVTIAGCKLRLEAVDINNNIIDTYTIDKCENQFDRNNGLPTGSVPMGTTQSTISLTTSQPVTCRYAMTPDIPYALMTNTFDTTGGTTHLSLVTGLVDGTNYAYYVRCDDGAGTSNINDYTISFRVAHPDDPPVTTTQTKQVNTSSDDAFEAPGGWPGSSTTSVTLYAGAPGSTGPAWGGWRWTNLNIPADAQIVDAYVEFNQAGYGYSVPTTLSLEDAANPGPFSAGSTPYDRWAGRTTFEAPWTVSLVGPNKGIQSPSLVAGIQELVDTYGELQEVVVLENGTGGAQGQYHEWAAFDYDPGRAARIVIEYSSAPQPVDSVPPQFSNIVIQPTADTATITWDSTEPATTQVAYGLSPAYGFVTPLDTNLTTSHTAILTGLTSDATYYLEIRGTDAADNLGTAIPVPSTFTTFANAVEVIVDAQVATSSDDAFENPVAWPGANTTKEIIYAGAPGSGGPVWGGWRWAGLELPSDAIITSAYVEFNQAGYGYVVPTTLAFENAAMPTTFSTAFTPYDRWASRTTFEAEWTWPRETPGSWIQTPSLVTGIQELVNTHGAINEVVLLEDGTDVTSALYHEWSAFDVDPLRAAKLHIEYSSPSLAGGIPAPTDMVATAITDVRIDLTWTDNATNESGYELEVSTTGAAGAYSLAALLPIDATAYSAMGLAPGTEHCYRVRAVSAAGESAYSTTGCASTLPSAVIIDQQVATSADDAFHTPTGYPGFSSTSAVVYAGAKGNNGPQWGGWRWSGLNIPAGAVVTQAYVELNQLGWGDVFPTTLSLEAAAAPAAFTSGNSPYHRWASHTAFTAPWTWPKATSNSWIQTPSLTVGVQELVDTFGGITNLVLLEDGSTAPASDYHEWTSFDYDPLRSAKLYIEYVVVGP